MVDFAKDVTPLLEERVIPRDAQAALEDVHGITAWARNQTSILNRALVNEVTRQAGMADLSEIAMQQAANQGRELKAQGKKVTKQWVLAQRDRHLKALQFQLDTRVKAGREGLIEAVKGGGMFGPEAYALTPEQFQTYQAGKPYKFTEHQALAHAIRNGDLSDDDLERAPYGIDKISPEGQARLAAMQAEEQWGRPDQAIQNPVLKTVVGTLGMISRPITGAMGGIVRHAQDVAPAQIVTPEQAAATQEKLATANVKQRYDAEIAAKPANLLGVNLPDLAKAIARGETHLMAGAMEGAKREALDVLSGGLETAVTPSNVLKNARAPFEDAAMEKAVAWGRELKAGGQKVTKDDVLAKRDEFVGQLASESGEIAPFALESPNLTGAAVEILTPSLPIGKGVTLPFVGNVGLGRLYRATKGAAAKHLPDVVADATMYVPEARLASESTGAAMKVAKDSGKVTEEAVQSLQSFNLDDVAKLSKPDNELVTKALDGQLVAGADEAAQRAALPERLREAFDAGDAIRKGGAGITKETGIGNFFDETTGELVEFQPRENYLPHLTRKEAELPPGHAESDPFLKSVRTKIEPGFAKQRVGGEFEQDAHKQLETYLTQLQRAARPAKEWQELTKYGERHGLVVTENIGDLEGLQKQALKAGKAKENVEKRVVKADMAIEESRDRLAYGERVWDELGKTKEELNAKAGAPLDKIAAEVLNMEKQAKAGFKERDVLAKTLERTESDIGKLDLDIEKQRFALKQMDTSSLLRTATATAAGVSKARGVDQAWRSQRAAKDALNELVQRKYALETKLGSMRTQLDRQTRRLGKLEGQAKYGRENYQALLTKAGVKDIKEFDRAIEQSEKYIAKNQKELHKRLLHRAVVDQELQVANKEFLDKIGMATAAGKKAADFEELRAAKESLTGEKWFYLDEADEVIHARLNANKAAKYIPGPEKGTGKVTTRTIVPEAVFKRYQSLHRLSSEADRGVLRAWARNDFNKAVVRPVTHIWRTGHTLLNPTFNPLNYVGALGLGHLAHGVRAFDPRLQGAAKMTATLAAMSATGGPVTPFMAKYLKSTFRLRGGKTITLGEALDLMRNSGLTNQAKMRMGLMEQSMGPLKRMTGHVENALRFGDKKYIRAFSPGVQAEWIDDYQKAIVFLGALEDTTDDAVIKAIDYTSKYAANYKRFDAPIDALGRDAFGFYSWMRFIAPHMLNQFIERPERLVKYMKARGLFERYASAPTPFFAQEPEYMEGRTLPAPMDYQLKSYKDYLNKGGGFQPGSMTHIRMTIEDPLSMGLPFWTAAGDLLSKGGVHDKELLRYLGPLAIAANEILTGHDFETDEPIPDNILSRVGASAYSFVSAPIERYKGLYDFLRANGRHTELMELKLRLKVHNDFLGMDHSLAHAAGKTTDDMPPTWGAFRLYPSNPWSSGLGKANKALQYADQVKDYRVDEAER